MAELQNEWIRKRQEEERLKLEASVEHVLQVYKAFTNALNVKSHPSEAIALLTLAVVLGEHSETAAEHIASNMPASPEL